MATGHFAGAVHSVFGRACNITLDGGGMLALLAAEYANVPHGARLATPPGFRFDQALRAGERLGCRGGIARFASAGLAVRLQGARRWHAALDDLGVELTRPPVATAWRTARTAAKQHARTRPRCVLELPGERREALADAVRSLHRQAAEIAIERLVGCGPGLTPAGDDLLVGFLAGMRATAGRRPERLAFLTRINAVVCTASAATNPISRTYLEHASDGAFTEPLARLANCIAAGAGEAAVEAAARAALAVGATSGTDGVHGLLDAMACWG